MRNKRFNRHIFCGSIGTFFVAGICVFTYKKASNLIESQGFWTISPDLMGKSQACLQLGFKPWSIVSSSSCDGVYFPSLKIGWESQLFFILLTDPHGVWNDKMMFVRTLEGTHPTWDVPICMSGHWGNWGFRSF